MHFDAFVFLVVSGVGPPWPVWKVETVTRKHSDLERLSVEYDLWYPKIVWLGIKGVEDTSFDTALPPLNIIHCFIRTNPSISIPIPSLSSRFGEPIRLIVSSAAIWDQVVCTSCGALPNQGSYARSHCCHAWFPQTTQNKRRSRT